jgi:hypothetical protein
MDLGEYESATRLLGEAGDIHAAAHTCGEMRAAYELARARLLLAINRLDDCARLLDGVGVDPPSSARLPESWLGATLLRAELELARGSAEQAAEHAGGVRARIEAHALRQYFPLWETRATVVEGKAVRAAGQFEDALLLLRRAVEAGASLYDPELSLAQADAQAALAGCLADLGRSDKAQPSLETTRAIHARHATVGEHYRRPLVELEARLSRATAPAASNAIT